MYVYNLAGYLDGDICMSKKTTHISFDINILRLCSWGRQTAANKHKKKSFSFQNKTERVRILIEWSEQHH